MSGLQIALLMGAVFVVSPIMNGIALSVLWGWFVAPIFHTAELSVFAAIGLTMTINAIIQRDVDGDKYKDMPIEEAWMRVAFIALINPVLNIMLGALVHVFA